MTKNTQRFDDMLPLFTDNENDLRGRLFLAVLYDHIINTASNNLYDSTNIKFNVIPVEFKNINFSESYPISTNPDSTSPEIEKFIYDVQQHITTPMIPQTKNKIINLIKTLSGNITRKMNEYNYFKQQVIRLFLNILNGTDEIKPENWFTINDTTTLMFKNQVSSIDYIINTPITSITPTNHSSIIRLDFSYRLSNFILQRLIEVNNIIPVNTIESSFFTEQEESPERFFRKIDDISKLWTVDDDGNDILVDFSSEYIKKKFSINPISNICADVGFKGNENKCYEYLNKCLIDGSNDDNIKNCKTYMTDPTYWSTVTDEVKFLLPQLAQKTLDKFGFEIIVEYDETSKRNLKKYTTFTNWLTKLHDLTKSGSDLTSDEYQKISNNTQLRGYLNLLVQKINSNPAILNENYVGKSNELCDYNPYQFKNSVLSKYGLLPRRNNCYSIARLSGLIKNNHRYLINSLQYRLAPYGFGAPFVGGIPIFGKPVTLTMVGGGQSILNDYSAASTILNETFSSQLSLLNSKNKQLGEADKAKIESLLKDLERSETKLIKVIKTLERYFEIQDFYKGYDPKNILSMDHIKQFVDSKNKYLTKVNNKQDNLLSVLSTIADNM